MLHTVSCTVLALAFGLLAAGLQDCANHADRFTLNPKQDIVCDKAHIGTHEVLVCTEVYRAQ